MNDKAQTAALSSAHISTFYSEWLRQTTHRGVKSWLLKPQTSSPDKEYAHTRRRSFKVIHRKDDQNWRLSWQPKDPRTWGLNPFDVTSTDEVLQSEIIKCIFFTQTQFFSPRLCRQKDPLECSGFIYSLETSNTDCFLKNIYIRETFTVRRRGFSLKSCEFHNDSTVFR